MFLFVYLTENTSLLPWTHRCCPRGMRNGRRWAGMRMNQLLEVGGDSGGLRDNSGPPQPHSRERAGAEPPSCCPIAPPHCPAALHHSKYFYWLKTQKDSWLGPSPLFLLKKTSCRSLVIAHTTQTQENIKLQRMFWCLVRLCFWQLTKPSTELQSVLARQKMQKEGVFQSQCRSVPLALAGQRERLEPAPTVRLGPHQEHRAFLPSPPPSSSDRSGNASWGAGE